MSSRSSCASTRKNTVRPSTFVTVALARTRMPPRAQAGLRLLLGVVLLAVDAPALAVFLALETSLLVRPDVPVCAGARLRCIVARLAALEPGRFPVRQLA